MTIVVALVLATLALAIIAYPLFRQRPSPKSVEDDRLTQLYSQREAASAALKELEFDLKAGSLSEKDYRDLEAGNKKKAESISKDIAKLERGGGVEDEIEKRVRKLRQAKGLFCPKCGASSQPGDMFCSRCGTKLSRGGKVE